MNREVRHFHQYIYIHNLIDTSYIDAKDRNSKATWQICKAMKCSLEDVTLVLKFDPPLHALTNDALHLLCGGAQGKEKQIIKKLFQYSQHVSGMFRGRLQCATGNSRHD